MTTERRLFYPPRHVVMGIAGGIGSFGLSILGLAVGAALFFSWMNSETVWSLKNGCVSGFLGCIGLLLLGMAVHFWRLGRVPLVVEADGCIRFKGKELIAAGAARELVVRSEIVSDEGGPTEIYRLFIQVADGEIELPSPYFSGCDTRDNAEALAAKIGSALMIPVVLASLEGS